MLRDFILALAGLRRLGLAADQAVPLDLETCLPAPGQGVLGLEARSDDAEVLGFLSALENADARREVVAERFVLSELDAGCLVPLAALWRPGIRRLPGAVVLPPLFCLPSALLAEFARFSERILDALGYQVYPFLRPSEVQEFYFYLFILLYLVALHRRLSHGGP